MEDKGFKYLLRNQVTNSVCDNTIQPDYYAFYFDIKSWGERIKTFIKTRIEKQPVWLFIDDGKDIYMILVLNLEQFEELSIEVNTLQEQLSQPPTINNSAELNEYDGFFGKELKMIDDKINRLEKLKVKEVDLEKIINDYFKDWKFDDELDIMVKPNNYSASFTDLEEIAKHFFELGLKAQKGE